jgi:transcription-repair coupling factor (superfamily II helicase)
LETAQFLKYFKGYSSFSEIVKKANTPPGEKFHLQGFIGSSKTIFLVNLFSRLKRNFVVFLNDREEAAYFYDDLNNLGWGENTLFFPSSYKRSVQYDQSDQENIVLRTEVLNKISSNEKPWLIVTYPEAVVETVISQAGLEKIRLGFRRATKFQLNLSTNFCMNTVSKG